MFTKIRSFYCFFAENSFYPLLLSTLLAGSFFVWRTFYTDRNWEFRNLVWNLFLAWIPYICALSADALHRLRPRRWLLLPLPSALWLLFVPNAPYIVTDFYHLYERWPVPLWYDIGLIAIFAITGCFLGIASLRIMQRLVKAYLGRFISWLFVMVSIAMCGLGIYLGRFGRYNSWDVFFHPKSIFREVAEKVTNPLDNLGFVGFTIMFTAILLVFYLMFTPNITLEKN